MVKKLKRFMDKYGCKDVDELFNVMENLCIKHNDQELPANLRLFLVQPEKVMRDFVAQYFDHLDIQEDAEKEVQELRVYLKNNPPSIGFKDPDQTPIMKESESHRLHKMSRTGVDLPACEDSNPIGLQYFSPFFMSMYLGNYDDFMQIIKSLNEEEIKEHMNRREGYMQAGPASVPILGFKIKNSDNHLNLFSNIMINGKFPKREGKQMQILEKLLELGADPNARDTVGHTVLCHALHVWTTDRDEKEKIVDLLFRYGADANAVDRLGSPLLAYAVEHQNLRLVRQLIKHGSNPEAKAANYYKLSVSEWAMGRSMDEPEEKEILDALKRRGPNACQVCNGAALKRCSACGKAWYCSPACQKQDWKKHKKMYHKENKAAQK